MTEPASGGADAADPRPWWKKPAGAAAAATVLAVVAVGGYFGVNALLPQPSPQTTSPPRTIEQVAVLPPGAEPCHHIDTNLPGPFNAGARGTPTTSCAFVEQVRKQYAEQQSSPTSGPVQLRVVSPATFKWYDLACLSSGQYVTCTGGAAAVVYLYHD